MNVGYIGLGIVFLLLIIGKLHRNKKRKNKDIFVIESNCSGCMRCVRRCPHHVLEMVSDETETHVVVKYPDRCTACGDCMGKCKFNALKLVKRV